MFSRRSIIVPLALSMVLIPILGLGKGLGPDSHDCKKVKKHRYTCVRGPLAGKTFKSEKAMIRALTKGKGPMNMDQKVKPVKGKKLKKAKAKKRSSNR